MSRLRGILRERAYLQARERWLVRHVRQQQATGKGLLEWGLLRATSREALVESELDILCDDLAATLPRLRLRVVADYEGTCSGCGDVYKSRGMPLPSAPERIAARCGGCQKDLDLELLGLRETR